MGFFAITSEVKNNLELSDHIVSIQNVLDMLVNQNNIKSTYKLYILESRKENYCICISTDNVFRKSKAANWTTSKTAQ